MNPQELPLRDIHLPDGVSWWPIAPGWWLILVLIAMVVMVIWAVRHARRRQLLRKQALAELEVIQRRFNEHQNLQQLASDCSILLRRACISRFNRHDAAGLVGRAWIDFLNQHSAQPVFDHKLAAALTHAPYQPNCEYNGNQLLSACRSWLHQLPPLPGGAA